MKKTILSTALLASSIALSGGSAGALVLTAGSPAINVTSRTFTGGFSIMGDSGSISGELEADHPKCVLSVPTPNPGSPAQGYGPNGSILLDGSSECAGSYELFLSDSASSVGNGGVSSGTFAIVSAQDQQTVEWAGTYTAVVNLGPAPAIPINQGGGGGCPAATFCANLGPNFGSETFNGSGLAFLVELNGFTWFVPGKK